MSQRRVVITGVGWITPLGHDVDSVWARLLAGESGMGPVTRFEAATFKTNFAAEVKGFRFEDHVGADVAKEHASAGLSTRFALAAATQAWRQSGLGEMARDGRLKRRRLGVYLGAGEGSLDFENYGRTNLAGWVGDGTSGRFDARAWAAAAYRYMDPVREVEQEPNMTVSHVAGAFGCRGPSSNCMTACAASTQAVGEATEILRYGDADVMLAGGAHSMIHPLGMTGFIRLTAMSRRCDDPTHASRPFNRTRDGFVMGEGAGMLVLETLEHALSRGATPLCEIAGYGSTADAFRITDIQPDGRGAQGAMSAACRQAGIDPHKAGADGRPPVHYISAHGTGTQENDAIETAAVKGVFGELAPRVPFSSVKSMFGHLIQAAGAVELITCVKAIQTGLVPPTVNLNDPDPECDLDYVPNAARDLRDSGGVHVCLSNSFGFGGQNDTLCVRRFAE
ncbi:MAG: beta-ketoacyl-[acyl-carrier-protein] synthase family protein [Phycisphaeraceae bacterium]|nr:beta-ketoacyl-[acyl-carrier-protein] synthase family protein [Phycisphaeraceae bacterium]